LGAAESIRTAPDDVRAALVADPAQFANTPEISTACSGVDFGISGPPAGHAPSPGLAADPFKIKELFIQVGREEDRPAVENLAEELKERGYKISGIETVQSAARYRSSVRYYYNDQKAEAQELQALLLDAAERLGVKLGEENLMLIPLEGRYEDLPRNRAEVWF
jgi:hypothetical protein